MQCTLKVSDIILAYTGSINLCTEVRKHREFIVCALSVVD